MHGNLVGVGDGVGRTQACTLFKGMTDIDTWNCLRKWPENEVYINELYSEFINEYFQ